jgi:hypothetical protein
MDTPFLIGLTLSSEKPVNAISVVIDIPYPLTVVDFSDGDSVINFWTIRPHVTNTGKLEFAGIIPGGFSGKGSRLITLSVRAPKAGNFRIALDPESKAYQNAPDSPEEPLRAKPLGIVAAPGKENISNVIDDINSPESFTPTIVKPGIAVDQPWTIIFSTVDKGSGMGHYEIAESYFSLSPEDAAQDSSLPWREAESPFVLSDQQLYSYVYVKAQDKKGNAVVVVVDPHNPLPWYRRLPWYIICLLIAVIVAYRALHVKRNRTRS